MLEDAAGIRRVVLACGTVDLRKASMAWQRLSAINMNTRRRGIVIIKKRIIRISPGFS